MFLIIGLVVVVGSVIGGYMMHHGKVGVLWQPTEFIIILGAGIGSMIMAVGLPFTALRMAVRTRSAQAMPQEGYRSCSGQR